MLIGIKGQLSQKLKWTALMIAPCVVYLSFNLFNIFTNELTLLQIEEVLSSFSIGKVLKSSFFAVFWWLYVGLFPTELTLEPIQRTVLYPENLFLLNALFNRPLSAMIPICSAIGVAVLTSFCAIAYMDKAFLKQRKKVWAVMLPLLVLFPMMLAAGRMTIRSIDYYLSHSSYNTYLFWLLTLIVAYAGLNFQKIRGNEFGRICFCVKTFLKIVLVLTNALFVFGLNSAKAKIDRPLYRTAKSIEALKVSVPPEQFSFSFDQSTAHFNKATDFKDPASGRYRYFEWLYPGAYTSENPSYILTLQNGRLQWIRNQGS